MAGRAGRARLITLTALDLVGLVGLRSAPTRLLAAGSPERWVSRVGADQAAATLAGALLWLLCLWFALALGLVLASALPGQAGAAGRRLSLRVAPRAVRQLAASAAGFSILLAPVSALASPSPTSSTAGPTASASVTVSWPVIADPAAAPAPSPPAATPAPPRPVAASRALTVRPGDSLWLIAAHRLGPAATESQIAAEWPRWYAANRTVIGADPGVLTPGLRLTPPTAGASA